jgi:hypothetical protein
MMQLKRFAMCCSVFVIVGLSLMVTSGYSADFADLVFYFPLDEGSGDKITDISPNKLVAKLENKPKWVQGKVKGGVAFTDGKSMGASVPANKILDMGTADVSLEAWFKTGKKTGQGFMFIKWDGPGYYIKLRDGLLYTRYHDGAAGGEVPGKTPIADDKWHHVVSVRRDKTTIQIYLDGKLDLEDKKAAGPGKTDNGAPLEIGRYRAERYWDGILDELRLWQKALSEEEVTMAMEGNILSVEASGKLPIAWGLIKAGY